MCIGRAGTALLRQRISGFQGSELWWRWLSEKQHHCLHYAIRGRSGVVVFSSRRRDTKCSRDWSSDVCSSDLVEEQARSLRRGRSQVFLRRDEWVPDHHPLFWKCKARLRGLILSFESAQAAALCFPAKRGCLARILPRLHWCVSVSLFCS